MNELAWIAEARSLIGLREIAPNKHPKLTTWQIDLGAAWLGAVPWCGVFAAHCAKVGGKTWPKEFYRASAWSTFGAALDRPAYGCIVTFTRAGGGHVGFCVGKDKRGNLMILGGNQGDSVCIKPFSVARVSSYRWLGVAPLPERYNLPVLNSDGKVSQNES